jgi:hypothetical protein
MTLPPLTPPGDALRHAVRWLGEHGPWTLERIEEACRRFDLTPLDQEFLINEYRRSRAADPP